MSLFDSLVGKHVGPSGNNLALVEAGTELSYRELDLQTAHVLFYLHSLGIQKGDRVLLHLPNCVDLLVFHLGIIRSGAISVPLEYTFSDSTLNYIFEATRPRLVVTSDETLVKIQGLAEKQQLKVCSLKKFKGLIPTFNNGADLANSRGQQGQIQMKDLAAIMYTTGATGFPKGVTLTHDNILTAIRNICEFVGYSSRDRELVTLPLSHNFGMVQVLCNLYSGGTAFLEKGLLRVGNILNTLESFEITGLPGTPASVGILLDRYSKILREKAKNLRFMVINSAPLPPERCQELLELLPNLQVYVYYGLTEASRSTFINLSQAGPEYYASVGKPMNGIQMKTLLPSGREAGVDVEGEVLLSGSTLTPGYWSQPDLTNQVIKEGWLHTKDLGRIDKNGFLFLTGRLGDMINLGGYKINPSEVENVIKSWANPAVKEICVFGVPDKVGTVGEQIAVAMVLYDGSTTEEVKIKDLYDHCKSRLEPYKLPNLFFRTELLPRTNTGKIKRQELKEIYLRGELLEIC